MNAPVRATPSVSNGAALWRPGELWSLWDIMQWFNPGLLAGTFSSLMKYSSQAAATAPANNVHPSWLQEVRMIFAGAKSISFSVGLAETSASIERLESDFEMAVTNSELQYGLHHLIKLMQSELQKRPAFLIEADYTKYYRDEKYGTLPPELVQGGAFGTAASKYAPDTAISCWGHVSRFMNRLAERMSETAVTPNVWKSKKK
jgi:hypothetical protein